MHFLTVLGSLGLALTSVTQASPLSRRVEARQDQAPAKFYLQTQVLAGGSDTGSNKHGLYLFSYHTGAGLGIAAAQNSNPNGAYFYLNGTELLWTYENNQIGPWPVSISSGAYQTFNPISISIAGTGPQEGYSVNATGLQSTAAAGWLACDWWYASPQIFALAPGYESRTIPSSCSKINLVPIEIA